MSPETADGQHKASRTEIKGERKIIVMKLKDRRKPGPNGFMIHEKRTDWKSWIIDPSSQWDFNLLCQRYQEHARANPGLAMPTDIRTIEEMVDLNNALRYAKIAGAEIYITRTGDSEKKAQAPQQPPHLRGFFQNVVGQAKNLNAGRRTLSDWWGEGGKPVDQSVADARALVCSQCPQNDDGGLLAKFTVEAAAHIRDSLEEMNGQKLVTAHDAKLDDHVCKACDCPLRLKVWTPPKHIIKNMPEDTKAKLDASCWILKECETFVTC